MTINASTEFLKNYPGNHYHWPDINESLNEAVLHQMTRSLSDQTAAGIIGEFEDAFGDFLGAEHIVAFSSGTAALHAMIRITGLKPGDELIVGAYGFFASVSPFAYEGVTIKFVDVDDRGNIDVTLVEDAITERTRAIMCVHMWGNPCDMPKYREICDKHELWLFEDCAHAHFARVAGRPVGVLSDLASFSFNQKALTAGEAGVLVCRDRNLYERAILFGHYNKRCFAEVSKGNPDFQYAMTGYGLKYRPHTISMAIGLHQIMQAEQIRVRRTRVVEAFRSALRNHPYLEVLLPNVDGGDLGLYVLPLRVHSISDPKDYRKRLTDWSHVHGAKEVDIPGSTTVMNNFALFNGDGDDQVFSGAHLFDQHILKLPLWGYPGDDSIVDAYCEILKLSEKYVMP